MTVQSMLQMEMKSDWRRRTASSILYMEVEVFENPTERRRSTIRSSLSFPRVELSISNLFHPHPLITSSTSSTPSSHTHHPIMSQTIYSKGILHSLATFHFLDNAKYSIIVTGANGISGSAMLRVLSANLSRWDKIYALSRRPPPVFANPHIIPITVHFLDSTPDQISQILRAHNVHADYVYFASYVQPPPLEGAGLCSDTETMTTQNVALLSNFLSALTIAAITQNAPSSKSAANTTA